MTKDLTAGNPMRLILGFALPTLFGMLFQQLYNLVDAMIVGKLLGASALAAVGSTGSINFFVIGFCMGLCSGFAIPVAQRMGAGEPSQMRRYVANAAWLSILFAVVLTAGDGPALPGDSDAHAHSGGHLRRGLRLHLRHLHGHPLHLSL